MDQAEVPNLIFYTSGSSPKNIAFFTEWNSSPLVRTTIKKGGKRNLLTPTTFSILHATDFANRLANVIVPPLQAGMIALADRCVYTAFARDVACGVHPEWVRNLYAFAVQPDIAFYLKIPIDVLVKRIMTGRAKLKFYRSGHESWVKRRSSDQL